MTHVCLTTSHLARDTRLWQYLAGGAFETPLYMHFDEKTAFYARLFIGWRRLQYNPGDTGTPHYFVNCKL